MTKLYAQYLKNSVLRYIDTKYLLIAYKKLIERYYKTLFL